MNAIMVYVLEVRGCNVEFFFAADERVNSAGDFSARLSAYVIALPDERSEVIRKTVTAF